MKCCDEPSDPNKKQPETPKSCCCIYPLLFKGCCLTTVVPALVSLSIALLLIIVLGWAGVQKLSAGGAVPGWFAATFGDTFLSTFPGLWLSFYSIVALELAIGLTAALSILTGEFLPGRKKMFLQGSLVLSLLIFAQLAFGKKLLGENGDVQSLFMYFTGILVMWWIIAKMGGTCGCSCGCCGSKGDCCKGKGDSGCCSKEPESKNDKPSSSKSDSV